MSAARQKIQTRNQHLTPIPALAAPSVRGYITEEAWETRDKYVLMVHPVETDAPTACPEDHEARQTADGEEVSHFAHAPYLGKSVSVFVIRRSHKCSQCGRTYCMPLNGLDSVRRMSMDLIRHIQQHPEIPSTKLAREVGVSEGSVLNVLTDYAVELIKQRKSKLPLFLGLDEIYLGSTPRCVITDLGHNRHFCLLEDNTERTIRNELRRYENRAEVVALVIDMSFCYRWLLEELFPNGTIIIDLFHVISLADECREAVRRAAVRSAPRSKRSVLRARRGFWDGVGQPESPVDGQMPLFGEDLVTLAKEAHEDFRRIFRNARNAREGVILFEEWEDRLPMELTKYYVPLIRALASYRDEIFANCEFNLSNGFTEGHNARIRTLHRMMPSARIKTLDHHLIIQAELKRLAEERDTSRILCNSLGAANAKSSTIEPEGLPSKVPAQSENIEQPQHYSIRSKA